MELARGMEGARATSGSVLRRPRLTRDRAVEWIRNVSIEARGGVRRRRPPWLLGMWMPTEIRMARVPILALLEAAGDRV